MSNLMFVLSLIFILVMVGIGPLLTILSLNALFGLQIALNFWSWLSVAWLSLPVSALSVKVFVAEFVAVIKE